MEDDLIRALLVAVFASALGLMQTARFDAVEKPLLRVALLAHGACGFVHILVTTSLYEGGDLFNFTAYGERLAELLRYDFGGTASSVLALLFHQTPSVDLGTFEVEGSSTGSMFGLAGWLVYLTGGSVYTLGTVISMAAYFGQVALYEAFKSEFQKPVHRRLLFAAVLVPSVIFWSAALLKEAVTMIGLGHALLGMVRLRRKVSTDAAARLVLGALPIGLTKPYILFGLVLAGAVWLYAEVSRAKHTAFKAGYVLMAVALAMAGVMALGSVFPQYAISGVVDQAVNQRASSVAAATGGSDFAVDTAVGADEMSLPTEMALAPWAIVTAIYRPSFFDATSVQVAVNAVETSALLFVTIRALRRRRLKEAWATVASTPMLMFALVFSLVLGLGVGLSTSNFGTLSRYRMPLAPFFWALILVLDARQAASEPLGRAGGA
jgi:hypothetical protein